MFKNSCILFLFSISCLSLNAQESSLKYFSAGLELQQYPTGFLLGGRGEFGFTQHSLDFRIGYNFVDHRDLGVHANEEGGGFGFTIGYRYYFRPQNNRFFLGVRSDLWFNTIEWQDQPPAAGTTNVVVLQPTAIAGYLFLINEKWCITPTLAFGWEINIVENGEPVGEGAILLWGVNFEYRFGKK